MKITVGVHADRPSEEFAPRVFPIDLGKSGYSFGLNLEKDMELTVFLSHDQMIDLRDVLTLAIFESPLKCVHAECEEVATATCDNSDCNARFCSDHGQKGGDQEEDGIGMVAVPSICDACIARSRR